MTVTILWHEKDEATIRSRDVVFPDEVDRLAKLLPMVDLSNPGVLTLPIVEACGLSEAAELGCAAWIRKGRALDKEYVNQLKELGQKAARLDPTAEDAPSLDYPRWPKYPTGWSPVSREELLAPLREYRDARDKAASKRIIESTLARDAEDVRRREKRQADIDKYVTSLPMTDDQRERYDNGVLPAHELRSIVWNDTFGSVEGAKRMEDLPHFGVWESTSSLTATEWALLKQSKISLGLLSAKTVAVYCMRLERQDGELDSIIKAVVETPLDKMSCWFEVPHQAT